MEITTTFTTPRKGGAPITQKLDVNTYDQHIPTIISNYQSIINKKIGWYQFLNTFSDEDECLELYFRLKFADHNCSKCGRKVTINYARINRKNKDGVPKKAFRCKSCRTHIYPLSDSIFRKTSVPLKSIFFIIFQLSNSMSSTSTIQIASSIDITYKTAHRLTMLIRDVIYNHSNSKMRGTIEIDEAFIGKSSRVYNWSSISTRKQPIIGMVERETKQARLFLVDNRNASTIHKLIKNNVEVGSTIYTDSWKGYNGLSRYYNHQTIDHSKKEFVRGDVHTNSIESLWGNFKRNIRKAHIKISAKYVQLYVNEACWRHNSRGKTNMQLFDEVLRLTF